MRTAAPTAEQENQAHPFEDEFVREWAWRFENCFNGLAAAAVSAGDFASRVAGVWDELTNHKPEMAKAWARFVARKMTDA